MYFEEVVLEYVDCICLFLNVDCCWSVLNTVFYITVSNFQVAVCFITESHTNHTLIGVSARVHKMSAKLLCLSRIC